MQTSNTRVYEPQICIVNHDHGAVITCLGTHIIMHGLKSGNFRKSTFKLKIQPFVFIKNLAKQLILVAKGIVKFTDSQRNTIEG
jgi:hypothetical protein